MILYAIYRNYKPAVKDVELPAEHTVDIAKLSTSTITSEDQSETNHDNENSKTNIDDDRNEQRDKSEDHREKSQESCGQDPLNKC